MKYASPVTVSPTRDEGRTCPRCGRICSSVPSYCICRPMGPRCGNARGDYMTEHHRNPRYAMAKKKRRGTKPYRA